MKYGKLEYLEEAGVNKHQKKMWKLRCDCGNECITIASSVRTGRTKSCGCLKLVGRRKTHGHRMREGKQTQAYTAWVNMKRRCKAANGHHYKYYASRGIKYCDSWEEFGSFLKDMGEPTKGFSLDRIDNSGNYEKSNCRWATKEEQSLNTRQNVYIEHNGKNQTIKEWADELKLKYMTLFSRIKRGMPIEDALTSDLKERWARRS